MHLVLNLTRTDVPATLASTVRDMWECDIPTPVSVVSGKSNRKHRLPQAHLSVPSPPTGELKDGTMHLSPIHYGPGDTVGSRFGYIGKQQALEVKQDGTYFMYLELNLTCRSVCESRGLTVGLHTSEDQLTCHVELPATEVTLPVTKRCWTVKQVHRESGRFVAGMTLSEKGPSNWQLERNGSGVGMFLVD